MRKQVFISYSSKEEKQVYKLKEILEQNNISCWMASEDIPSGGDYAQMIPQAIGDCSIFLLILSEVSQQSKWVPKELKTAIDRGKLIIPFHIDNSALSEAFSFCLEDVQRIDAYKRYTNACKELVRLIENNLDLKDNVVVNSVENGPEDLFDFFKPAKVGVQKRIEKNGIVYMGETRFGKMHGYGIATYPNGGIYEGYWNKNTWHGKGVMKYAGGDVMKAVWIDDTQVEQGVLTYANGDVCEIKRSKTDYTASVKYKQGDVYEGKFMWERDPDFDGRVERKVHGYTRYDTIKKIGCRNGPGVFKSKNGTIFEGIWLCDSISGNGTIRFVDGAVYQGEIFDFQPVKGTMTYANKEIYVGDFSGYMKHGYGKMVYADGTVYEGKWKYDEPAS